MGRRRHKRKAASRRGSAAEPGRGSRPSASWRRKRAGLLVAAAGAAVVLGWFAFRAKPARQYRGDELEFRRFITAERSIELDARQREVQEAALEGLSAPCCADYTAASCCCDCNLARSIWGLSKKLIAEEGASASEVRRDVRAWIAALNPAGFGGKACHTGGCGRPPRADGCGGMEPAGLVF